MVRAQDLLHHGQRQKPAGADALLRGLAVGILVSSYADAVEDEGVLLRALAVGLELEWVLVFGQHSCMQAEAVRTHRTL